MTALICPANLALAASMEIPSAKLSILITGSSTKGDVIMGAACAGAEAKIA